MPTMTMRFDEEDAAIVRKYADHRVSALPARTSSLPLSGRRTPFLTAVSRAFSSREASSLIVLSMWEIPLSNRLTEPFDSLSFLSFRESIAR